MSESKQHSVVSAPSAPNAVQHILKNGKEEEVVVGSNESSGSDSDHRDLVSAYQKVLADSEVVDVEVEPLNTSMKSLPDISEENEEMLRTTGPSLNGVAGTSSVKRESGIRAEDKSLISAPQLDGDNKMQRTADNGLPSPKGVSHSMGKSLLVDSTALSGPSATNGSGPEKKEAPNAGPVQAKVPPHLGRPPEIPKLDLGQSGDEGEDEPTPVKCPDSVMALVGRLKAHYARELGGVCPCPWLRWSGKPASCVQVEPCVRERRHNSILRAPALDPDEFIPAPGDRILLLGPSGAGRSMWMRNLAHQWGRQLLPALQSRFLLTLFCVSSDLEDCGDLADCMRSQLKGVAEGTASDEEIEEAVMWFRENQERVLFLLDLEPRHATSLIRKDLLLNLLRKEIHAWPLSASVMTAPLSSYPDFPDKLATLRIFDVVLWSDDEILKYLRGFSNLFEGDEARTDFLEFMENLDCCQLLQIPEHCSLICLLYRLDPGILSELPPRCRTHLFGRLFVYLVRQMSRDSTPEEMVGKALSFSAASWERLSKGEVDEVTRRVSLKTGGEMEISNRRFEEFLAAKFVALRYFEAARANQAGALGLMSEVQAMFTQCWDLEVESYSLGGVCVHLAALLANDFHFFVEALASVFPRLPERARKECLRICGDINSEVPSNRALLVKLKTAVESGRDSETEMGSVSGFSFCSIPDGLDARNLSSLKLNEATLTNDEALQHLSGCLKRAGKLKELEIDFTPLDPALTQRVAFSPQEIDFMPLKEVVDIVKKNRSLQDFTFGLKLDVMSLESVDIITGLFDDPMDHLINLSVGLYSKPTSSFLQDASPLKDYRSISENLKLFATRLLAFLNQNSSLHRLELAGCFLQMSTMSILQPGITDHPRLSSLSIRGAQDGGGGAGIDPHAASVLADVIRSREWEEVSVDFSGFTPSSKRSVSTGYLNTTSRAPTPRGYRGNMSVSSRVGRYPSSYGLGQNGMKSPGSVSFQSDDCYYNDVDVLLSQVIKALHNHSTVIRVALRAARFHSSVLDPLSDMIERCAGLRRLELASMAIDDAVLLAIGCGVVCATQLEWLSIGGSLVGVVKASSLAGLFQSCSMCVSLCELHLRASPLSARGLDWLLLALPDMPMAPARTFAVVLEGQVACRDVRAAQKKLDKLKAASFHPNFQLDVQLKPVLKERE